MRNINPKLKKSITFLFAASHFIVVQNGRNNVHSNNFLNLLHDLLMGHDDGRVDHLPVFGQVEIFQLLLVLNGRVQPHVFVQTAVLLQQVQQSKVNNGRLERGILINLRKKVFSCVIFN